jgi:hypothetical protein
MRPGFQVLEVLFSDPRHHLVVVQVLLHLHVVWVGKEEGVCCRHGLVQLVDLSQQAMDRAVTSFSMQSPLKEKPFFHLKVGYGILFFGHFCKIT